MHTMTCHFFSLSRRGRRSSRDSHGSRSADSEDDDDDVDDDDDRSDDDIRSDGTITPLTKSIPFTIIYTKWHWIFLLYSF